MKSKLCVRIIDGVVLLAIGYYALYLPMTRPRAPEVKSAFAESLNLEPLRTIAVHTDGRLKSFDSFARTIVRYIAGPKGVRIRHDDGIEKQSAIYSYLDLMFNPSRYRDKEIIYLKKQIRPQLARVMERMNQPEERIERFLKDGMLSERELNQTPIIDELMRLDADVLRTSKFVSMVNTALHLTNPRQLANQMRIIPPPAGDAKSPWIAGPQVWGYASILGGQHNHNHNQSVAGIKPELAEKLEASWNQLADGWRARDAATVNAAVTELAELVRTTEPNLYPETKKLEIENAYFRWKAFTWNWIVYLLAAAPLLMFVLYRWKPALYVGFWLLMLAFLIHTAGLGIRWYISGRIPNSNMFEAITAAAWFGVVGAFVLEILVRKTAMRGLFFLGAGLCSMVAMMCQHFMPTTLTPDIENVMPVLNDLWLYIHTNVIIFSYALIGMAAITALLYLRYRAAGGNSKVAKAGGAGSLILEGAPQKGQSFLREDPLTAGMVLDASTMVLMELSFVLLWAGLVMGAIWADHSWGRPWGWDPKEVFALCTFVIFMLLIHVRLKVRDKGLWTALLAVVGCAVMLFNWIVINFKITGLHSYA